MRTASGTPQFDSRTLCATAIALALGALVSPAKGEDAAGTKTQVARTTGPLAPPAVLKRALEVSASLDLGKTGRTLFFGYVEFDQNPEAPGGVPGFGPLPNSASQLATAGARQ